MRIFMLIMLGLPFWLATQAIGLGLAGGGHGWNGPFLFSAPLIVLYPLAFVRAFGSKAGSSDLDVAILAVALILDFLLLANIFGGEGEYFIKMWRFPDGSLLICTWLALWAGWQVLLAISLLRKRLGRDRPETTSP